MKRLYGFTQEYQDEHGYAKFSVAGDTAYILIYPDKIVRTSFVDGQPQAEEFEYSRFQLMVKFNLGFGFIYDRTNYLPVQMRFEPAYLPAVRFVRDKINCPEVSL